MTMLQPVIPFPLSLETLSRTPEVSNTQDTSSSTTTRVRVRAREEMLQLFGNEILDAYEDVFGRRMMGLMVEDVNQLLSQGMEAAVIVKAIEETAAAPMPSWRYTMAILRRCAANGVTTLEGWRADKNAWSSRARRRSAPEQPKKCSQQMYTQREHHEDDLAELVQLMGH